MMKYSAFALGAIAVTLGGDIVQTEAIKIKRSGQPLATDENEGVSMQGNLGYTRKGNMRNNRPAKRGYEDEDDDTGSVGEGGGDPAAKRGRTIVGERNGNGEGDDIEPVYLTPESFGVGYSTREEEALAAMGVSALANTPDSDTSARDGSPAPPALKDKRAKNAESA